MRIISSIFCFIGVFVLSSCSETQVIDFEFIANPANGYVSSKESNGLRYTLKYIPQDLLLQNRDWSMEQGCVFLMNIQPIASNEEVLFYSGVDSYEMFAHRNEQFFFDMDKYFYMKVNGQNVPPVHSFLESNYGVTSNLAFYVQFDLKPEDLGESPQVYFHDVFFKQGSMLFKYKKQNLLRG